MSFPGGSVKETWVQSLGQEYPLEKGMATHYSMLAWRIPWTEEPDMTEQLSMHAHILYIIMYYVAYNIIININ